MHVVKVCFYLFIITVKLIAVFFRSHNLQHLYLTNNIQQCGGHQCEYYFSDFIIDIQIISKLKCGNKGSKYIVNLKLFPYI